MLTVAGIPQYAAGVSSGASHGRITDVAPETIARELPKYPAAGLLTDTLKARSHLGRKDEPHLVINHTA